MRALSSGDLPAIRDNRNSWKIEAGALDAWAKKRPGPSPDTDRSADRAGPDRTITEDRTGPERTTPTDTTATLARLAAAEAKIEGLEARLADTQADRDAWRQQAERLASKSRSPGIFGRIFGRR